MIGTDAVKTLERMVKLSEQMIAHVELLKKELAESDKREQEAYESLRDSIRASLDDLSDLVPADDTPIMLRKQAD